MVLDRAVLVVVLQVVERQMLVGVDQPPIRGLLGEEVIGEENQMVPLVHAVGAQEEEGVTILDAEAEEAETGIGTGTGTGMEIEGYRPRDGVGILRLHAEDGVEVAAAEEAEVVVVVAVEEGRGRDHAQGRGRGRHHERGDTIDGITHQTAPTRMTRSCALSPCFGL